MIYTVTLNPALDYVMSVSEIEKGETNRSTGELIRFGGKGINVSFVLKELGEESTALGFIAGFTGDKLAYEVENSGVRASFTRLGSGMTRINVKLKSDCITEVNADGPEITEEDTKRLLSALSLIMDGDTLVLSGSVPKKAPHDIYERILAEVSDRAVRTVVDTSGSRLIKCLPSHPWLVKPNKSELEELVGGTLISDEDIAKAARELQRQGAKNVLVSLGEEGAMLVTEEGEVLRQSAFEITPVNTVGAGDSAVAGYIVGIKDGYEAALRLACAAGAAAAASDGLATKKAIEKLLS